MLKEHFLMSHLLLWASCTQPKKETNLIRTTEKGLIAHMVVFINPFHRDQKSVRQANISKTYLNNLPMYSAETKGKGKALQYPAVSSYCLQWNSCSNQTDSLIFKMPKLLLHHSKLTAILHSVWALTFDAYLN